MTSTAFMRLASEPLRLPLLARCPALGASPWGGCLQLHPIRCGRARTAPCAWRRSARRGPRGMRARVHRHTAGTAHTRFAAAAMLTYSMLRTPSAPCAGRTGVSMCTPEEWGPPWQRVAVREFPPSRARPPGRLTATASEPYVSACARVCWTRAARGCALSPSPLPWCFPRRLLVRPCRLFVSKKTV